MKLLVDYMYVYGYIAVIWTSLEAPTVKTWVFQSAPFPKEKQSDTVIINNADTDLLVSR